MAQTFAEKILAKKAGWDEVVPGQMLTVRPDHLLTHIEYDPRIASGGG